MKIGIIGSGISGLVAAWQCQRNGHEVTIFESEKSLGMDSQSLDIEIDNTKVRADVPSRMLNESNWPTLTRLCRQLDVELQSVDSSQSYGELESDQILQLKLPYRFKVEHFVDRTQRQIVLEIDRFKSVGQQFLDRSEAPDLTFNQFLENENFHRSFIDLFLFPVLSTTVCTCSYEALKNYPARIILQALGNLTDDSPLLRIRHGVAELVTQLIRDINEIRLQAQVRSVLTDETTTNVTYSRTKSSQDTETEVFDHVIISTQANHACLLIDDSFVRELELLRQFQYETVKVIVHTDKSLMPQQEKQWSTFNMMNDGHMPNDRQELASMCSIWLNRFHRDWTLEAPVFQTIRPFVKPDSRLILKESQFQRPLVDERSHQSWNQWRALHSEHDRSVWFCGSYAIEGVPLLESGVVSSLFVCDQIQQQSIATEASIDHTSIKSN